MTPSPSVLSIPLAACAKRTVAHATGDTNGSGHWDAAALLRFAPTGTVDRVSLGPWMSQSRVALLYAPPLPLPTRPCLQTLMAHRVPPLPPHPRRLQVAQRLQALQRTTQRGR